MLETLKKILNDQLDIDISKITMESDLIHDLGLNSLELADLILEFENTMGIEIPETEYHNFHTVADVVSYLEKNQKQ